MPTISDVLAMTMSAWPAATIGRITLCQKPELKVIGTLSNGGDLDHIGPGWGPGYHRECPPSAISRSG